MYASALLQAHLQPFRALQLVSLASTVLLGQQKLSIKTSNLLYNYLILKDKVGTRVGPSSPQVGFPQKLGQPAPPERYRPFLQKFMWWCNDLNALLTRSCVQNITVWGLRKDERGQKEFQTEEP